jgi:hypothetical protein
MMPLSCCRVHDEHVNFGEIVLAVVVVWSVLSIVVSLAIGGMAKARDAGPGTPRDHDLITGLPTPTAAAAPRDDGARAAL